MNWLRNLWMDTSLQQTKFLQQSWYLATQIPAYHGWTSSRLKRCRKIKSLKLRVDFFCIWNLKCLQVNLCIRIVNFKIFLYKGKWRYPDILTLIKRGDSIQTSVKSRRIWDTILTVDISFASRYFIKFWDPNPNPPQHTSVNIVDSRNEFNVKSSNVKSNIMFILVMSSS